MIITFSKINFATFCSKNNSLTDKIITPRSKIKQMVENSQSIVQKQVKASGPGGQHVNKTNSAVYMKELTTDVSVKVTNSRDSEVNRGIAKKRLIDKIDLELNGKESKIGKKIEKEKKQKNKNYRRSKDKHQNNNKKL